MLINLPIIKQNILNPDNNIYNISVQAHKPLQMIKALTATGWGKQKKTLMATYKAVMRPALEYASSIWSHLASSTSINQLQVMHNATLRNSLVAPLPNSEQMNHPSSNLIYTKSTPNHIHHLHL